MAVFRIGTGYKQVCLPCPRPYDCLNTLTEKTIFNTGERVYALYETQCLGTTPTSPFVWYKGNIEFSSWTPPQSYPTAVYTSLIFTEPGNYAISFAGISRSFTVIIPDIVYRGWIIRYNGHGYDVIDPNGQNMGESPTVAAAKLFIDSLINPVQHYMCISGTCKTDPNGTFLEPTCNNSCVSSFSLKVDKTNVRPGDTVVFTTTGQDGSIWLYEKGLLGDYSNKIGVADAINGVATFTINPTGTHAYKAAHNPVPGANDCTLLCKWSNEVNVSTGTDWMMIAVYGIAAIVATIIASQFIGGRK